MPDRTQLLAEADSILHRQTFTKEDSSRVESLLRLADSMTDRAPLRSAILDAHGAELGRAPRIPPKQDPRFVAYLRGGADALTSEERRRIGTSEKKLPIKAVQTTSPGSAGGYIVPASFSDKFQTMLQLADEIFLVAQLWESTTGTAFNYPLLDDTQVSAAIIAEAGTSNSGPDAVFAAIAFGATPMWRSGLVTASVELVQDSAFNLEALLATVGAVRIARGAGKACMTTLLSTAPVGTTSASPTALLPDEIFSLIDSLDAGYGDTAQSSFLMKRSTLTAIHKLKAATTNTYLFEADDRDASGRQLLLGYPVYFSPNGDPLTASSKPISFGRHDLCIRRDVRDSLMARVFVERYAEFGRQAFECYLRTDFGVPSSTTGSPSVTTCPIRTLQMHS